MKKIVFDCVAVTNIYSYGANKNNPEIRGSSLKSLIRIWWRVIYKDLYNLLAEDPQKKEIINLINDESKIFGGDVFEKVFEKPNKKSYSLGSKVTIKTKVDPTAKINNSAFNKGSEFKVEILAENDHILEIVSISFFYLSIFGGIGQGTRKGEGAFKIKSLCPEQKTSKVNQLVNMFDSCKTANELNEFLEKLNNKKLFNEVNLLGDLNEFKTNITDKLKIISKINIDDMDRKLISYKVKLPKNENYKCAYLGLPVMRNYSINSAFNVKRRASQLIFKKIKNNNIDLWIVFILKDPFLLEEKLFLINNANNREAKAFLGAFIDEVMKLELK